MSERRDLNSRPPEPHSGALPGYATLRKILEINRIIHYPPNNNMIAHTF